MRHNQDKNAVIEGCPAEDAVLTQRPVLVEAGFEVNKIATLAQAHFLSEARELVQVRGEIEEQSSVAARPCASWCVPCEPKPSGVHTQG